MNSLKIFLSHKSEYEQKASKIAEELLSYSIKCFVAKNIRPTRKWEEEILDALQSMDILVALMTENFKDSDWTSQEIGFALGRNIPILSVNLGSASYGFTSKYQDIRGIDWEQIPKIIVNTLLENYLHLENIVNMYIRLMEKCPSFNKGNELANYLPNIKILSDNQIDKMIEIYNSDDNKYNQISGSMGFSGSKPEEYGKGLVYHLNRIREKQLYRINDEHKIIKIDS